MYYFRLLESISEVPYSINLYQSGSYVKNMVLWFLVYPTVCIRGTQGGGGGTPQGLYNIYTIKLLILYKTIKPYSC